MTTEHTRLKPSFLKQKTLTLFTLSALSVGMAQAGEQKINKSELETITATSQKRICD